MDFESFCKEAKRLNLTLNSDDVEQVIPPRLDNEALFHLPFISMVILLMTKDARKPKIPDLGQLVGDCFERTFTAYKSSSQHLSWSANLRIRTVKALSFLELSKLIIVENRKGKVTATELGKKVVNDAIEANSDLSYNLLTMQRNYRNICKERQMELELL